MTQELLDPEVQTVVAIVGRKGSGKSKLARYIAQTYPWDQIHIDLHGVDRPWQLDEQRKEGDPYYFDISDGVPDRWPEWKRPDEDDAVEIPMIAYYQPDAGSSDIIYDMDQVVKLAYVHTRCLLVVHEWGELGKVHRTPPFTRRVLSQGRGRQISLMMLMHRPANVDPMTFTQSDLVGVFQVPNKRDRETIANGIGWDIDDFSAAVQELPPYGYLLYDRRIGEPEEGKPDTRLLSYPPLSTTELKEIMHD